MIWSNEGKVWHFPPGGIRKNPKLNPDEERKMRQELEPACYSFKHSRANLVFTQALGEDAIIKFLNFLSIALTSRSAFLKKIIGDNFVILY